MNREIKFRGQCAISKELVCGDLIHGIGPKSGNLYILPNKYNLATVKHCDPLDGVRIINGTESQYTGLKDKNGIEIYEGDILLIDACKYFVVFSDGAFRASAPNGFLLYQSRVKEDMVIGNIHEHPHLLK